MELSAGYSCLAGMKIYQLKTVQNLPIGIEEAWEFFSNSNIPSIVTLTQ
jgi:hypothetical protein